MIIKIYKYISRFISNPIIRFDYLSRIGLLNFMSDKKYLEVKYKLRFGKKLNLDNPKSFNEKLQWLKINDRKALYTLLVDKFEVKKIVSEIIGESHIIPTIGCWNKFEDIDFDKLPDSFVLKCTHDSGGVYIVKNKKNLDMDKIKQKMKSSLKRNYFYSSREWPYKNVKPRIIAEEFIQNKTTDLDDIADYKFMCFNGKVKLIFTCTERNTKSGLKVTFFDLNWNIMPFERHYPKSKIKIQKPIHLTEMIKFAEMLSKDIPFVRIDFYEVENKVYFGEYTFYPGGGFEEFTPEKYDYEIGNLIDIKEMNLIE